MCSNKTFFKKSESEQVLAVGHSLTTTDLMYGVRYERGLQWYSVYTDDGESWIYLDHLFIALQHCIL